VCQILSAIEELCDNKLQFHGSADFNRRAVQFLLTWLPLRPADFSSKADRSRLLSLINMHLCTLEKGGQLKLLLLQSVCER
jgi:hypothetical protein